MLEKSASQLLLEFSGASTGKPDEDPSPLSEELSSRRELVNLLDAEPLLGYLVQNGVLRDVENEEIARNDDSGRQNLLLLKLVERRPNGVQLFTNALRQTGQHYLANLVDDGIRIKALSGSGYLSKSRHKGQVELQIRVKSMKLQQPIFKAISEQLHKDWISLEDIQTQLSSVKRFQSRTTRRSSAVDHDIPTQRCSYAESIASPPPTVVAETDAVSEDSRCRFCCCYKSKSPKKMLAVSETYSVGTSALTLDNVNGSAAPADGAGTDTGVVTCQPPGKFRADRDVRPAYVRNGRGSLLENKGDLRENGDRSVENLRSAANKIQEKCLELYASFSDTSTAVHVDLLRYLEQERGILNLSVSSGDFLQVLCICTKPDHITRLREDSSSGRLTAELEKILTAPEVLLPLGISGVRLEVEVNKNDLEAANQELA